MSAVVVALTACVAPGPQPDAPQPGPKLPEATTSTPAEFQVIAVSPPTGSTGMPRNTAISLRLNTAPDAATVKAGTFRLQGVAGSLHIRGKTLVFEPSATLSPRTTYTAMLSGIKDTGGRALSQEYRWTFTTGNELIPASSSMRVPTPAGQKELLRYPYLQIGSPRQMHILWTTTSPGQGAVWVRTPNGRFLNMVTATASRFSASQTKLGFDFVQHEAVLEDLEPDSTYTYYVTHNNILIAEGITLKTLAESDDSTVRFIAFGDSGSEYSQPRAVRDAIANRNAAGQFRYPHDFIVGLGDIAYHNGTYIDFDQRFFNQLSGKNDRGEGSHSILMSRPFVPVLGNHEYGNNEKSVPEGFIHSFSNPTASGISASEQERYYSFESGDAHFVVIDSMKFQGRPTAALDDMLNWLDTDLSQTRKKWRIIFFHHAVFAHGPHGTYGDIGQNRGMRQRMLPILQKHGVQLAMNGHDHLYERTKRMQVDGNGKLVRDRQCQIVESDKGIVYLTVGIGGYDLHNRKIDPLPCGTPTYEQGMREYGEGYDFIASRNGHPVIYDSTDREPKLPVLRHGFAHVTIGREQLHVVVYNFKGETMDDFVLH